MLEGVNPATHLLFHSLALPERNHTVLRANLAHYNAQLQTPITDPWDLMDSKVTRTPDERRWVDKISREIGKPYDDHKVAANFASLDHDLRSLLAVKGSKFPSKVYVTGGINQGRFGGNSDLDVIAEGLLSPRSCGYLAAQPGWKVHQTVDPSGQTVTQSVSTPAGVHAEFLSAPHFETLSNWFGKHFEVDVARARQGSTGVKEAIQQGFESKGFGVTWADELNLHGSGSAPGLESSRPYPLNFGKGYSIQEVAPKPPTLLEQAGDWLRS